MDQSAAYTFASSLSLLQLERETSPCSVWEQLSVDQPRVPSGTSLHLTVAVDAVASVVLFYDSLHFLLQRSNLQLVLHLLLLSRQPPVHLEALPYLLHCHRPRNTTKHFLPELTSY